MKTYRLTAAALATHPHTHPDRVGYRNMTANPMEFDVVCKVWPSRAALAATLRMQDQRERRSMDWRPLVRFPTL